MFTAPTKAGSRPDFHSWESRWSAGFLGGHSVPLSLHSGVAPYPARFALIGSQYPLTSDDFAAQLVQRPAAPCVLFRPHTALITCVTPIAVSRGGGGSSWILWEQLASRPLRSRVAPPCQSSLSLSHFTCFHFPMVQLVSVTQLSQCSDYTRWTLHRRPKCQLLRTRGTNGRTRLPTQARHGLYSRAALAQRVICISSRAEGAHQDEPGSIPGRFTLGFSHVAIVLGDTACRRVLSGYSRFPRPLIPALLHPRVSFHVVSGDDWHLRVPAGKSVTQSVASPWVLRASEGERLNMEQRWNERMGGTIYPRGNPPTRGNVRHEYAFRMKILQEEYGATIVCFTDTRPCRVKTSVIFRGSTRNFRPIRIAESVMESAIQFTYTQAITATATSKVGGAPQELPAKFITSEIKPAELCEHNLNITCAQMNTSVEQAVVAKTRRFQSSRSADMQSSSAVCTGNSAGFVVAAASAGSHSTARKLLKPTTNALGSTNFRKYWTQFAFPVRHCWGGVSPADLHKGLVVFDTVVVWLDNSPLTKENRVRFPNGLASGFSRTGIVPGDAADRRVFTGDLPFTPPLHSSAAPYTSRFTLIGSQDLGCYEPRKSLRSPQRNFSSKLPRAPGVTTWRWSMKATSSYVTVSFHAEGREEFAQNLSTTMKEPRRLLVPIAGTGDMQTTGWVKSGVRVLTLVEGLLLSGDERLAIVVVVVGPVSLLRPRLDAAQEPLLLLVAVGRARVRTATVGRGRVALHVAVLLVAGARSSIVSCATHLTITHLASPPLSTTRVFIEDVASYSKGCSRNLRLGPLSTRGHPYVIVEVPVDQDRPYQGVDTRQTRRSMSRRMAFARLFRTESAHVWKPGVVLQPIPSRGIKQCACTAPSAVRGPRRLRKIGTIQVVITIINPPSTTTRLYCPSSRLCGHRLSGDVALRALYHIVVFSVVTKSPFYAFSHCADFNAHYPSLQRRERPFRGLRLDANWGRTAKTRHHGMLNTIFLQPVDRKYKVESQLFSEWKFAVSH
ncbi:hypothetical protein PR048_008502 [Dryococelus australis]|uniref:Uncharacterized protein n=1 Tax=Dryococelus australis TaxID=614101 RepID=A0ABQ9HXA8_9NEOP|nr:hypothetical protein PR048_008502 [Dryococelus australis]